MKMKVTEKPVYPEIEVFAKTSDSECGTIDRKKIGRCLLTLEAIDKDYEVVGGDGVSLKTVKEVEEYEVNVELVGNIKSLASFKFFKAYTASNKENDGVIELFTTEEDKLARLRACAARMCEAHPECDNQWKIVGKNDARVFVRLICKNLTSEGRFSHG